MACLHPLRIKNRRYIGPEDYVKSQMYLRPYDYKNSEYLLVPCGHCEECLRAERNGWFLRLEREFERCRAFKIPIHFVTLTIKPELYESYYDKPNLLVRRWLECIRHKCGHSFKHFICQEFGKKDGRLHFHGLFFGIDIPYADIRACSEKKSGFVFIDKATPRTARYITKYIVKDMSRDFIVTKTGRRFYALPIHRRKFVSAHVGDYLGTRFRPVMGYSTWTFSDRKKGIKYAYSVPRYYDRFIPDSEKEKRSIFSAFVRSRFSDDSLVRRVNEECFRKAFPSTSFSDKFVIVAIRRYAQTLHRFCSDLHLRHLECSILRKFTFIQNNVLWLNVQPSMSQ